MRIAFLHDNNNQVPYSSSSLQKEGVSGTENSVIHLAEALAARGHEVFALNRLPAGVFERSVTWMPLRDKAKLPPLDIAVGVNSNRVYWGVRSRHRITWLHNPPALRPYLKRRNLLALLYHRPHAVLLGTHQSALLHPLIPYKSRSVIAHGLGDEFFAREPEKAPRRQKVIFCSQPTRGLDFVARAWEQLSKLVPNAEFHVFCPKKRENEVAQIVTKDAPNVYVHGSVSRGQLAQELRSSRLMLIPGDRDETFCLAAAEAVASGVPLVTLGIGALAERVSHGKTGFIASSMDDFVRFASMALEDDALWLKLHAACVIGAANQTWSERVADWEQLFAKLDGAS